MAWEHLAINRPHLVYIILGGFTSLFMLCSSVIKERLYIGEATVATICGIIFGPHAANLIDPNTWGNTDQITLEFSRIVLVVQCFAVGVELPRAYMERHWKSVVFLLVPVMTFGWLITSLFIWAMFSTHLDWLDSLTCAACVTATDPVLASSVVGKGKFAKRVPKHLRDLLSAESGCNDGMAFPFIYLALYIVKYRHSGHEVALHWFCITILYECIFGAVYGVVIGYLARRAIRYAHENDLIDRESFLVFYFVLALFCAGSGSILGVDDLLVGFACGVGFSNDGWFTEKTEESHVSNVIDLLINLAFFVYFGTIIPWAQYNSADIGTTPWRLVVVALLVLFFRRIPIMLALKPVIPDIKLWREALFAGHFGPIGVGAIFVAILARADLETGGTTPLYPVPGLGTIDHSNIILIVWPLTTFLVITSIIVHGSSIAVFTLGKHINTLTITMSYTQGSGEMSWMERLPRIQSRSKSMTSFQKPDILQEDLPYPQAVLGLPKNFLRRQKEDDPESRASSSRPPSRRLWSERGFGAGGPISQSAIAPQPRKEYSTNTFENEKSESDTLAVSGNISPESAQESVERQLGTTETQLETLPNSGGMNAEVYQEGEDMIFEDDDGIVLDVTNSAGERVQRNGSVKAEAKNLLQAIESKKTNFYGRIGRENNAYKEGEERAKGKDGIRGADDKNESPDGPNDEASNLRRRLADKAHQGEVKSYGVVTGMRQRMNSLTASWFPNTSNKAEKNPSVLKIEPKNRSHGPARAFRLGRTLIVEDEDGEVIKKYNLPAPDRSERKTSVVQSYVDAERTRERLHRVGTWLGISTVEGEEAAGSSGKDRHTKAQRADPDEDEDDDGIRFRMDGNSKRMNKAEFIRQVQSLDPKSRSEVVQKRNALERVEEEARTHDERRKNRAAVEHSALEIGRQDSRRSERDNKQVSEGTRLIYKARSVSSEDIPFHSISQDLRHIDDAGHETGAQQRRRQVLRGQFRIASDADEDITERNIPAQRRSNLAERLNFAPTPLGRKVSSGSQGGRDSEGDEAETAAERRRREAALGTSKEDSDEDDVQQGTEGGRPHERPRNIARLRGIERENTEYHPPPLSPSATRSIGIRFADEPSRPNSASGGSAHGGNGQPSTWRGRMTCRRDRRDQ